MNISKRGTGRTTRMCQEALNLLHKGRAVYVYTLAQDVERVNRILAGSVATINHERGRCLQFDHGRIVPIDQPPSASRAFISVEPLDPMYDFRDGKVPGMHPNCVCLVDHACVERQPLFQALLRHWEQFDAAPQPVEEPRLVPDRAKSPQVKPVIEVCTREGRHRSALTKSGPLYLPTFHACVKGYSHVAAVGPSIEAAVAILQREYPQHFPHGHERIEYVGIQPR